MKRCTNALAALFGLFFILTAVNAGAAGSTAREIDTAKSTALFSVEHIFVETVTGTVPILRGTIVLPRDSMVPLSVSAVLDPARIKTGEDDRDGALQTADWFDTKRFPTWTFAATKISPASNGRFAMDGILTIHGVGRPVHLDVAVSGDAVHPVYHATGHVDRHAFGMNVTRLDPAVGTDVTVTLDIRVK